jgi:hypothetical protein
MKVTIFVKKYLPSNIYWNYRFRAKNKIALLIDGLFGFNVELLKCSYERLNFLIELDKEKNIEN